MNINLFKKQKVVTVDYANQQYVTQDEFKEFKLMIIKHLNKKVDKDVNELKQDIKQENKNITHTDLEKKSEIIIQDIHKHIEDINQYNNTINAYLLKQLRDKIDDQEKIIEELYDKLDNASHGTLL
jgi:hypothetical protein